MSLRIIGGQYRRRHLKTPHGKTTRPYTDRVRQIVFDRLGDSVESARVADIFSGVGTMGLEALSRGAASCVFIEGDPDVHASLTENVSKIVDEQPTVCWKTSVHRTSFCPQNADACLPYDLIFFDPPYVQCPLMNDGGVLQKSMDRLAKDRVSTNEARLILRTPFRFDFCESAAWKIHECWRISSMKIYTLKKYPPASDDGDNSAESAEQGDQE